VRVWNGVPGAGGSTIVFGDLTGATNQLNASAWTDIYRVINSAETSMLATNEPVMRMCFWRSLG
jgi:hypothetical protein